MKRVCVLGNSHAACFKLAWDGLRDGHLDVQLTFFADRGRGLGGLTLRDHVLTPRTKELRQALQNTSGGASVVDLRLFDAVLLVGLYVFAWPDALYDSRWQGFHSRALTHRWLTDCALRSAGYQLAGKVRAVSDLPIYVAHHPLLRCTDQAEVEMSLDAYRSNVAILNEAFRPTAARCLEQPHETIVNARYTKDIYAAGAVRLQVSQAEWSEKHAPTERQHMNTAFGSLWLAECLSAMRGSGAEPGSTSPTPEPSQIAASV
ncbi:MAG TPA: hypothetical protein VFE13_08890 [Caulobacteraceae bacterium]|nr:hypothetical protein [Caulobacteraceae bacterium]